MIIAHIPGASTIAPTSVYDANPYVGQLSVDTGDGGRDVSMYRTGDEMVSDLRDCIDIYGLDAVAISVAYDEVALRDWILQVAYDEANRVPEIERLCIA